GNAPEGAASLTLTLTVGTADGPAGQIVDGKVYLQLDHAGTDDFLEGGVLSMGGMVYTAQAVTGVTGVPNGTYYVIDVGASGGSFQLNYTPPARPATEHVPGEVRFVAYTQTLEAPVANLPATELVTTGPT